MKFHYITLMPYAALDLEERAKHETAWVTLPNRLYDPVKGKQLYETYIADLIRADTLGWDGVVVNEHHQTAYGMMPSPIVIASILARETKKCRIAILGSALPLRDHPLTLAEEHAMIDTISGGRLISGFVRGIGAEYHAFGTTPARSHDRFHEAHDLVVRAWTEEGPFAFEGDHYHFQYVNMWPRPFQRPHPPIWIPSQGSAETVEWSSHPSRKYTYLQTFSPLPQVKRFLEMYREAAERHGYTATRDQLGWSVPIYVGETDEIARREAKPHFENFRRYFLKMPMEMLLPPGYLTLKSMQRVMGAKGNIEGDLTLEKAIEAGMILCGSAATVRDQLADHYRNVGFGQLLTMLQFGTMPGEMTERNQRLFAAEVMAPLRKQFGADTKIAAE